MIVVLLKAFPYAINGEHDYKSSIPLILINSRSTKDTYSSKIYIYVIVNLLVIVL